MSDKRIIRRDDADVLNPNHTALVVLDGAGEAYDSAIPDLVDRARANGVFVVFTDYQPIRKRGERQTRTENRAEKLMRPEDICVPRINYSCFFGNCLHALLRYHEIETVIICGGTAETSLYTSLCEAQYHDYYACMASDTASCESEEISTCAYALAQKRYRCMTTAQIIQLWSSFEGAAEQACPADTNDLDPDHTALVVVDMQRDFCDPDGEYARTRDISGVRKIIPVIQELLADAREQGVLPLFFRQVTPRDDRADNGASLAFKTRDGKRATYALEGTDGGDYIDEISIFPNDIVIPKLRSNGFHETYMEKVLRANEITNLVFVGTQTEGCVLSSMMGAEQNGFLVIPVADGMATSVAGVQEPALRLMDARYSLWTAQEVMAAWKRTGRRSE